MQLLLPNGAHPLSRHPVFFFLQPTDGKGLSASTRKRRKRNIIRFIFEVSTARRRNITFVNIGGKSQLLANLK